jgi:CHAD domain-containing protein
MDAQREVEVKLGVPDGFEPPHLVELAGVDRVAVRTLRLRATYWDSEDRRLARGGMTLRHRTGEGRPRWTLKTATSTPGGLDREEISVPGPGTQVPPALQDLLTARLRGAELHGLAQVRTLRTTTLLFDAQGDELVEVVDDEVTVLRDGAVVDGWRELEVEQRPHGRKVAKRVVAALLRAGATDVDQTPKGVRALGAGDEPDLPEAPPIRSAGDLVRASLANGLRSIVEQDLAVRRELPDAVHQLRVACRRLRSDLRTFAVLLDEPRIAELRGELSWLAGSLGAARDLEVLRERVHVRAREGDPLDVGPVDALLAEQEEVAAARAAEALRSPRYLVLLQLLHDVAVSPQLSELAEQRARDVVPRLVDRAAAKLGKALRRLDLDSPDTTWHRARIKAKRARYAAEAAAPVLGRPSKHAKRLQTRLGEHQDAVVAAERLLVMAAEHPDLAVLCARLAERERVVTRSVRRSLLAS